MLVAGLIAAWLELHATAVQNAWGDRVSEVRTTWHLHGLWLHRLGPYRSADWWNAPTPFGECTPRLLASLLASLPGALAAWALAPRLHRSRLRGFAAGFAAAVVGTYAFVVLPGSWQSIVSPGSREGLPFLLLSAYAQFALLRWMHGAAGLPPRRRDRVHLAAAALAGAGIAALALNPSVRAAEIVASAAGEFSPFPRDELPHRTVNPEAENLRQDGAKEARADIAFGRPRYLTLGRTAADSADRAQVLRERFGIRQEAVAGCLITRPLVNYAAAYDGEILRYVAVRFGPDAFPAAEREAQARLRNRTVPTVRTVRTGRSGAPRSFRLFPFP